MPALPSYDGGGLVNLVAEIERRLTGSSPSAGLHPELAQLIPAAATYVLVVFDGLGDDQLVHPAASSLLASRLGRLEAGFATTTTVSLATLATGLDPRQHGVIGHLMWLGEVDKVVNTLKWVDLTGLPVQCDTAALLPHPNLWERIRVAGLEPITIQPGSFAGSPLSEALYRGCRFEPVWGAADRVEATLQMAEQPGRLIVSYVPEIDFAAHVYGQQSDEYVEAVALADWTWSALADRMPPTATLVGTSDHGMVEVAEEAKIRVPRDSTLTFFGDPRAVLVKGPLERIEAAAAQTGAALHIANPTWWGPGPSHPAMVERLPDAILLAPPGSVLLPPAFDRRLRGYHGGLQPEEMGIPLLVA